MFPYVLFILLMLIAYRYKAHRLMFIFLTVFAAIRYDVGWDYAAYIDICTDQIKLEEAKDAYSVIWYLLFEFAYNHSIPEFPIILSAIVSQWCTYKAFRIFLDNDAQKVSGALFFYVCWPFFYLNSFSIIRQSVAIAIVLLALAYLYRKKILHSVILWGTAVYLHTSAIFSLPAMILLAFKKRVNLVVMAICVTIGAFSLANLEDLLLLSKDIAETYSHYLEDQDNFGAALIYLMGGVSLFALTSMLKDKDRSSLISRLSSVVFIGATIEIMILNTNLSSVLIRVMLYFSSLLSVIFFDSLSNISRSRFLHVMAALGLAALFIFYLIYTYDPTTFSASSFVPYRTIFL